MSEFAGPGPLKQSDVSASEPHNDNHYDGALDPLDLSNFKAFTDLLARVALLEALDDVSIRIHKGAIADIPAGWQLCDGTNGTLNLQDKFILGAGGSFAVNATGGNGNFTHQPYIHQHAIQLAGLAAGGGALGIPNFNHTDNDAGHTHDAHPLPPYYALAFIQKVA